MKKLLLISVLLLLGIGQPKAQNFQWAGSFSGPGVDVAYGISVGASGAVYTTGRFLNTVDFDPGPGVFNLTGGRIFISKLNAAGNFVWAKQLGSGTGSGSNVTNDAAENVYVTGEYSGLSDFDPGPGVVNLPSASGSAYICKYDSSGNLVWAKALLQLTSGIVYGVDVALDPSGNVLVAGYFEGNVDFDPGAGSYPLMGGMLGDAFLVKLDPSGNFVWARRSGTTDTEAAQALAVDAAGNAYFTNSYWFNQMEVQVQKYNAAGTLQWVRTVGGTGTDDGNDIAVDATGNVYVTGRFDATANFNPQGSYQLTSNGFQDGFLLKLTTTGTFAWAKQFGSTLQECGNSVSLDAAGNPIVVGYFGSTCDFDPGAGTYNLVALSGNDPCAFKLDASGNFMWALRYGTFGSTNPIATDIGPSGELVTTGQFTNTNDFDPGPGIYNLTGQTQADIFIQKLGPCALPSAPSNTTAPNLLSICAGNATTLTASGTGSLTWYATPTGGSVLTNGSSWTTPVLNATSTYYVQDSTCAASARTAITVTVHQPSSTTLSPTACNSYTSPAGNIWTSSGTYHDTLTNQFGCDSILTINLTIQSTSSSTLVASNCGNYVSPSGHIWTSNGTYLDTIPNQAGCDSIITVNLTIVGSSTSTISPSTCDSYTSPSGLHIWNTTGVYHDTILNMVGCDSIITVNLTVNTVNATVTNAAPTLTANAVGATYQWIYCDSVVINGATNASFTALQSGDYAVIVTQNGCTDTSACETVLVIGMQESDLGLRIYPNPTAGHIQIHWEGLYDLEEAVIYNVFGQPLAYLPMPLKSHTLIEIKGSDGIYFLGLKRANGELSYIRVLKQQ